VTASAPIAPLATARRVLVFLMASSAGRWTDRSSTS
jgi:hypothetical protein